MGPGKIIFAVFATGLAIVFGMSALDNINNDNIYQLKELAGIGILSFVFVGCIGIMLLFSLSDAVCAFMERRGDHLLAARDPKGARLWYDRCLWIQDHLLNNIWRRTQIAGKHVATYQSGSPIEELQPSLESNTVPRTADYPKDPNNSENQTTKFVVPPAVANNVFYKYAFAIIFALVAVVHAMNGTAFGALGILFVGIVLNAYWLTTSNGSAD